MSFSVFFTQNETAELVIHAALILLTPFLDHRLFHRKIHGFPYFTSQHKFVLPYRVIEPIMVGCTRYLVGFALFHRKFALFAPDLAVAAFTS